MKMIFISVIFLFVTAESRGQRPTVNNDIIKVDVTKSYSSKKELILQDFMDVEYIVLETNDDFINQGVIRDVGKNFILVTNENRINDGNIFVYDRTGKALRMINHKGQGTGEYINIGGITLDEENNEMFVNCTSMSKILIYDLYGNFKRSFEHKKDSSSSNINDITIYENTFYTDIFNYDRDNLICYDEYNEKVTFVLVSKQDGSITKEINIPFKKKKLLEQTFIDMANMKSRTVGSGLFRAIIPFKGDLLLLDTSSDTIYKFMPDYSLRPFLTRTPAIESMEPEVFLMLRLLSDRYIFMEGIKNEYDWDTNTGFPGNFLMYDRQEKTFSGYTVYNGDYSIKKEMYLSRLRFINHEIELRLPLQAYQLIEDYNNGVLKGKLKEIASKLDEEDNPVIMLIKHKK